MGIPDLHNQHSLNTPLPVRDHICLLCLLCLTLLATPKVVLAHSGHGEEFQGGNEANSVQQNAIQVDAETTKRLGIKVEPVTSQRLAVGIKTTGQIETLPSKKVDVTTPIQGAKVVELLVEPAAKVTAGQPIAVLTVLA